MRTRTFAVVATFLLVLIVGVGAVYAYDSAKKHVIAKGVRIAGVNVGGMSDSEARRAVATEYASRLKRPIVVVAGHRRWTLSAKQARVGVDTSAAVDEALNRSRDGDII